MTHGARPLRSVRRLQNLRDQRPGWYSIKNQAAGQPTIVSIYDEIGFLGTSASSFMDDLREVNGDIELHINSPGGDVFDGIAIYNQLRQRGNVHVIIDGLAASAASFIAQAAAPGKLEMAPHSQMMIHDGFAMAIGNAADMRELADQLDAISEEIASIYAERSGKPASYFRGLMQKETWLTDSEAVAAGLADRIHGQDGSPSDKWDLSVYNAAPAEGTGTKVNLQLDAVVRNADKYQQEDRDRMAKSGEAMPDGSYPIADAEDLGNAIHAVGRGNADHNAIRQHIIKRADALGLSSQIPDDWNSDGSMKDLADSRLLASLLMQLISPEGVH